MSNLKIDIIYYKTASDFEMEFNLSGCCRMRMFKDKVDTPKGLVNTLARDVARSKIIIVIAELFGDNNGVSILSKAIKLPLVQLDKQEFGIKTTDNVLIPQTAVPLVTKSGVFGGCIIENGPQSIIIVSSARALRHEIMKAYVHNYVFDVGQLLAYQERMGSTPDSSSVMGKHTPTPADTAAPEPVLEEKAVEDISSATINNFTIVPENEATNDEIPLPDENVPFNKKRRKKGRGSNIVLLIIVVLLLLGFGILAYYFVYLPLLQQPGVFTDGNGNAITEFLNGLFS